MRGLEIEIERDLGGERVCTTTENVHGGVVVRGRTDGSEPSTCKTGAGTSVNELHRDGSSPQERDRRRDEAGGGRARYRIVGADLADPLSVVQMSDRLERCCRRLKIRQGGGGRRDGLN